MGGRVTAYNAPWPSLRPCGADEASFYGQAQNFNRQKIMEYYAVRLSNPPATLIQRSSSGENSTPTW
jgi:hypothetical protein